MNDNRENAMPLESEKWKSPRRAKSLDYFLTGMKKRFPEKTAEEIESVVVAVLAEMSPSCDRTLLHRGVVRKLMDR